MQEEPDIFLLMGSIHAPHILTYNPIH